jgi:hypothetical protein
MLLQTENPKSPSLSVDPKLLALIKRGEAGDSSVLPALREAFDEHPQVWQEVGDLARNAERSILSLAAGSNVVLREAIARQLAHLKRELAEDNDSPLLRLLIERTALCWLETYYLDALAAQLREQFAAPYQVDAIERRRDHAQHRFLSAARALATVRKLLVRTPTPFELAARASRPKEDEPAKVASRSKQPESRPRVEVAAALWN